MAFSAFGDRQGEIIAPRGIVDRPLTNAELSAFVSSDSLKYIEAARFRGVDVQIGIFTQSLQGFPLSEGSYLAVSTGMVKNIPGHAQIFANTNVGGVFITGGAPTGVNAYDVATITLRLDLSAVLAASKPKLSFVFKFMSEEVPTYVGSPYQDFFTIKAFHSDGTYIGDIARLPNGSVFTIDNAWPYMNQVGGSSISPLPPFPHPNDVVFNGVTDVATVGIVNFDLTALAGKIIILEFQIGDAGDEIFDSAVFIDSLRIVTEAASPQPGELWLCLLYTSPSPRD